MPHNTLTAQYDGAIVDLQYNQLQLAQGSSPSNQSGASGAGQLYLNTNESAELNIHLPIATGARLTANVANTIAAVLTPIPSSVVKGHFWGLGFHSKVFGGDTLGAVMKYVGDIANMVGTWHTDQASMAWRTAGYQRRSDEWTLQANLAARELAQIGSQLIASLLAEQVAYHDYMTVKKQVQQSQDVKDFLTDTKFTTAVFYGWMQSELSGLYYQYYRLACDTARKAEQTMKRELMRPELDETQFVQFNYWDTGHQGLLSGEALYLDVKRMEMAYHDANKRELELTRHVSLRQLDPLALLALRITGSCTVSVPEWLFDRDCPGHYLRRLKCLRISLPSVVSAYTSVNCKVTLEKSSVRVSPQLANGTYARDTTQDDPRFVDYYGSTDEIVTSSAANDSGMFETNLRDERFLPFEGAGAISTWNLTLPADIRAFDYTTISDVILHISYTAREAGDPLGQQATKELQVMLDKTGQSGQALLFCLRFDFPAEWAAFVNGTGDFEATIQRDHFPDAVQSARRLSVDSLTLNAATDSAGMTSITPHGIDASYLATMSKGLSASGGSGPLSLPADDTVLVRNSTQQVFLVLHYHYGTS